MARSVLAIALLLVVASCGAETEGPDVAAPDTGGSDEVFCNVWPDARADLLASWNNESESDEDPWAVRLEEEIARYNRIVPAALRAEWDRAHTVFTDIADLRFTVGYQDSRIRPEHLAMVFGEAGPDAAITEAEAAIDDIDVWAATSCGDFCSRWEDLEAAVWFEPSLHLDAMREVQRTADRREMWIGIGDQLVPAGAAAAWETASSIHATYLEFVRDRDFENDYTTEEAEIANFARLAGQSLNQLADKSSRALDTIHEWRSRNCSEAALTTTGSGSGRLNVQLSNDPSLTGSTVLLALMPDGDDFGSVRSITDYVAGSCGHIDVQAFAEPPEWPFEEVAERIETGHRPEVIAADFGYDLRDFLHQWGLDRFGVDANALADELEAGAPLFEVAEAMGFDPLEALTDWGSTQPEPMTLQPVNDDTEYNDEACQFLHEQEAILEPGDYELFVGGYNASPGDWRFFVAAPTACASVPVTIGGDTTVEVPPLGPCSIGAVGSEREIARRSPLPGVRDSALHVRLPTPHSGDNPHGCNLAMAILPAGTTLNDVGRGDIWPSGGVAVDRPPLAHVDPSMATLPVLVPILAYPTTSGLPGLFIDLHEDGSWAGASVDPIVLHPGEYDLHVEQACFQRPDGDEDAVRTCGMASVDVQGATTVDLPELGECP